MKNNLKVESCIHCGKCTRNCSFLAKYGLDISNTEKLKELAYHCFLCGKCSESCPVGIDGRGIILKMRQDAVVENGGKVPEKGYGILLLEKKEYLFRNYRHVKALENNNDKGVCSESKKSVFFPGCNFPSFYPKTNEKLISALEEYGIGVVFDCCGKPIAELGLKGQEEKIIKGIENRLKENSITELIMACPNCYGFLKGKLKDIRVISVYEKLRELGIGKEIEKDISVFLPCPDRKERELLTQIESYVTGDIDVLSKASCCGLGGCAAGKEPDLAKVMAMDLKELGCEEIHTYCASCAGNLTRNGCGKVTHVLTEIVETYEKPDISSSFLNRVKMRFY